MLRVASFGLLVMMLSALLQAAEPATAPAEIPEAEAANTDDASPTTNEDDIDEALAEEIRVAEEAAANAPPPDTNEPFVPSVQISEDLSVSFPVDI